MPNSNSDINETRSDPGGVRRSSRINKGIPPQYYDGFGFELNNASKNSSHATVSTEHGDNEHNDTVRDKRQLDIEFMMNQLRKMQKQMVESQFMYKQESEERERYVKVLLESVNKMNMTKKSGAKPKTMSSPKPKVNNKLYLGTKVGDLHARSSGYDEAQVNGWLNRKTVVGSNQKLVSKIPVRDNALPKLYFNSTTDMNSHVKQYLSGDLPPHHKQKLGVRNVYQNNVYKSIDPERSIEYSRKLLDLPAFSGKPEDWPMFIVSYNESNAAYNYSDLENTIRLQKCLSGDVKSSVQSRLIFPQNVDAVNKQLEFLYGRPEHLIKSQLNEVSKVAPIDEKHLYLIIPFAVKVRNLSTFLETTRSEQHLGNPILMEQLIEKLPIKMRVDWVKHSQSIQPYATVTNFSDWINQEARLISKVVSSTMPSTFELRNNVDRNLSKKNVMLHVDNQEEPKVVKCVFCQNTHMITDCGKFNNTSLPDKWKFVKLKRLCFCCLKFGHNTFNCRKRKVCGKNGCLKSHHKSLHEDEPSPSNSRAVEPVGVVACANNDTRPVLSCKVKSYEPPKAVLFKVIPIEIFGQEKVVSTYAMIDEGSSVSLIEEDLANELNLNGIETRDLNLQWFGDVTSQQKSKLIPTLRIRGVNKNCNKIDLKNVRTIKNMHLPVQTLGLDKLHERYHHLKNLPIANYMNAKPSILIGVDNCLVGLPSQVKSSGNDGPIVVKTKLGWLVYGNTTDESASFQHSTILHIHDVLPKELNLVKLHNLVKEYFTTENFGVMSPKEVVQSTSDIRALQILESTTVLKKDKFETGLLWKTDDIVFPNSFPMAVRRLNNLEVKMKKDPVFAAMYVKNMRDYIDKGYAVKLTNREANYVNGRTWYLPHFSVKNPSKPDKLRIVFDAAASVNGVSLNSMMLSGPDQYQSLVSILHRFRQGKIGVCGDIRDMFSRIQIIESDRNSQRFLWRENVNHPIDTYVMVSMIFGAKCTPCSEQYVKNCNATRFVEEYPEAVRSIIDNHYVDDLVQSFTNEVDAIKTTEAIVNIHRAGGFELCKIVSNSKSVENVLNKRKSIVEKHVNMNITSQSSEKILGMHWNTVEDEFGFDLKFYKVDQDVVNGIRPPTKRELLSLLMSVFDPFGFIANFMIYFKLLLQELWKIGVDWDDPVYSLILRLTLRSSVITRLPTHF